MATEAPPKDKSKASDDKPKRVLTEYTIFVDERPEGATKPYWTELGTAEALNDTKAIQALVGELKLENGTFVAIPSRSFRPRTVKVETNPRVRIG